jgi:tetratricopeptide (TPR) repeat protein
MFRVPLALALAVASSALAACGPPSQGGTTPQNGPSEALAGLPPRQDPPLALDDDDDLRRARDLYGLMPVEGPERAARRAELWKAYEAQMVVAEARNDVAGTYEAFADAMEMWTPEELADESKPGVGLQAVLPTADRLYNFFSKAGADEETVAALAVVRAAAPDRGQQVETAWTAIAGYADDLEIARFGPGAERARPIRILEGVTAHVASPWACRLLAGLYLDRQAARVAGLGKNDERMEGAHGPGIRFPMFNLIRAYARMGKFEQVPPILDGLAGQIGDDEQLRSVVKDALAGKQVEFFVVFADQFSRGEADTRDLTTARRLCESARRLHPRSAEPERCLGMVSVRGNLVYQGIKHIETALKRAPADQELAALLINLLNFSLGEYLQGERLNLAKTELARIEALHADVAKRWPGKPIDPGIDATWTTYGRGLYALGEIDESLGWLKKAHATKPNAEAIELIALIELKRGKWKDAARDFEAAAALPRETPLEKRIDEARLLRLAAEAREGAGDKPGAVAWYRAALEKWDVVLGSGLTERQRTTALVERGRLLWALELRADALRSFEAAIDAAGESGDAQVYSDVIAFLFPRGEYEAALDAYHRALARTGVTEYFKIYCSLWIAGAARQLGRDPDPLAMEFLGSRVGTRWYHDLARFAGGKLSWDELFAKANTRGKRAEAFFYQGMNRYAANDRAGGDRLMRLVIATDMLGFFEYDMAAYFLAEAHKKPAPKPVQK